MMIFKLSFWLAGSTAASQSEAMLENNNMDFNMNSLSNSSPR